jgi:hypothetical protein
MVRVQRNDVDPLTSLLALLIVQYWRPLLVILALAYVAEQTSVGFVLAVILLAIFGIVAAVNRSATERAKAVKALLDETDRILAQSSSPASSYSAALDAHSKAPSQKYGPGYSGD